MRPVFSAPTASRLLAGLACLALYAAFCGLLPAPALAQSQAQDSAVLDARDAARRKDPARLAAALAALEAGRHPLLPWAEYWALGSRLKDATVDEVEAFYQRWPGSYVEDRLRNDWLLELGRRRDFANLARDYPRFRMDDDREVRCWWLLTEHLAGKDVREPARQAWMAQREVDEGCNMLATAMVDARRFSADEVYAKARLALEQQRPAAARAAVSLLGEGNAASVTEALEQPLRWLRRNTGNTRAQQELRVLALMRLAASDAPEAVPLLRDASLSPALAAWTWAYAGRQAAFKLSPEAVGLYQQALAEQARAGTAAGPQSLWGWGDDTLAWGVRAALRSAPVPSRWPLVLQLIDAMGPAAQQDPSWQYWRAQALRASARPGAEGEARRAEAQRLLQAVASPLHFYGQLAADELQLAPAWPPQPAAPSEAERQAARQHPGLQRAQLLLDLGLRSEGLREWNFSLRGMGDRALLASARLACEPGTERAPNWQICINTAERSRGEVDLGLRYPAPYLAEIRAAAGNAGLDLPLVLGLIRQETRFMPQLRSHVGATGLMQVMPETGRLVARRLGIACCSVAQLADPALNLRLGTQYLRQALDNFGGSQAMATAAYNAGPGRPRRWREGATVEAAAWAEGIPFNETRDYVKRVLANAAIYQGLHSGQPPTLRGRLGTSIGPAAGSPAGEGP